MNNSAPFEILAAPYTMWLAPVGTAFPNVDETPSGPWAKVGTSGDRNYAEEGVKVQHSQGTSLFRSVGSTGPRKIWRTEEDLKISLLLADVSLEQYAMVLNHQTVATDPAGVGTPGTKTIGLSRGQQTTPMALLLRGASPYGDNYTMQYEVPLAVQTGSPEAAFTKSGAAALAIEFTAIEDTAASTENERFGRIVAQTADAET